MAQAQVTRTQRILELLAERPDGMTGVDIGDALHASANKCGRLAMRMALAGTLHRTKSGNTCWYFLTAADRDSAIPVLAAQMAARKVANAALHKAREAERGRHRRSAKPKRVPGPKPQPSAPRSRHNPAKLKPSKPPQRSDTREVTGMDTAKRTVSLMPPDGRYFVDPREPIIGGWLSEFRTRCAVPA